MGLNGNLYSHTMGIRESQYPTFNNGNIRQTESPYGNLILEQHSDQVDLADMYRTVSPTTTEYIFFVSTDGQFYRMKLKT